jgi:putative DNA primase/helicase
MRPIRECQAEIDLVYAEIFAERVARRQQQHSSNGASPSVKFNVDDDELLNRARNAATGEDFRRLYDLGDIGDYGGDDSRADYALLRNLLFWTQGDTARAARLFWASALGRRAKWRDREDYRASTIAAAAQATTQYYDPSHYRTSDSSANDRTGSQRDDSEPEVPVRFSDIALSNKFVGEQGPDLRYVRLFDCWFEYDERAGRWIRDIKLHIFTRVKQFLTRVARDVIDNAEAAAKHDPKNAEGILSHARKLANILTNAKKVADVVSLSRSHRTTAAVPEQFDRNPFLLNTPTGAVDLRTGTIRPAQPDDYFTKSTAVPPRDEPTPNFDRFLREIMGCHVPPERCKCAACVQSGDKAKHERFALHQAEVEALVEYIQRLYGYALTGDVSEHKLFLQIGEGGNGKGTLNDFVSQDILANCPAGFACEIPIEALLESKGERHPTELMDLWHTRLALARESDEDTRWNEGRVKRLTGGDRIKARFMRQDYVEFDATHKLVVFGNAQPTLRGGDQAAWKRRLQMTNFPQLWGDCEDEQRGVRQRDPELRNTLRQEASGVLYKLITACTRWYRDRDLKAPRTIVEASDSYLAEQSTILIFLDERYDRSNEYATTTVNEIWSEFVRWSEARHEHPGRRNPFNGKLERAGIVIERTGAKKGICRGLELKPALST